MKIKYLRVVGTDTDYKVGVNNVRRIKDNSAEWENGFDFMYQIYDNDDGLIAEVINCPVIIEYFVEE